MRWVLTVSVAISTLGAPAWAQISLGGKPALGVGAHDGKFTSYSAAQPFELGDSLDRLTLTPRVTGAGGGLWTPTYGVKLDLAPKDKDQLLRQSQLDFDAAWSADTAILRSGVTRKLGFGVLPKVNYLSVSVGMDLTHPLALSAAAQQAANIRTALTLDGRPVGAVSLSQAWAEGPTTPWRQQHAVDFSLIRPFRLPTEIGVKLATRADGALAETYSVKLVSTRW